MRQWQLPDSEISDLGFQISNFQSGGIVAVLVRSLGAAEAATFDKGPDAADDGDEVDEDHGTRFAAVMPALYLDCQDAPNVGDEEKQEQPEENEGKHRAFTGSEQGRNQGEQHQHPYPCHGGTPKRPARDAALETPEDLAPGQSVLQVGSLVTGRLWGLVRISQCALAGGWSPQGRASSESTSRAELGGGICLRLTAGDETGLAAGGCCRGRGACRKMNCQLGLSDWKPIRHPLAPNKSGRRKCAAEEKLDECAFFNRAFLSAVLRVIPHGAGGWWEIGARAKSPL